MVLPIGFFAPLPLPMMIPFMGIQSAVMAEQFGTMFQYGKRRISAMSNEEFNKLTPQMLQERITVQVQGMIPEMEKQIQAMRPMVVIIMKEFAEYVRLATEAIAKGGEEYLQHAAHGHIFGHGDTYVPPSTTTTELAPEPTPEAPTTAEPTLAQQKELLGNEIEQALQAVKDYQLKYPNGTIGTGNYPVIDYQNQMTRLLSSVTVAHNTYHDKFGEWYVAKIIL